LIADIARLEARIRENDLKWEEFEKRNRDEQFLI